MAESLGDHGAQVGGSNRHQIVDELRFGDVDEDDEDVTEHIMRSPCPPGNSFFGSRTDLRTVALAQVSARMSSDPGALGRSAGPSLFKRP